MEHWHELLALLEDGPGDLRPLSPGLIELAERAGVLHVLAADPELRAVLGPAAERYLVLAAMGALWLRDLQEIAGHMEAVGIPLIPLKGMAYALMFQRGGPTRPMADIDLLVPADRFVNAVKVMRRLGYREGYPVPISRAPDYHERAFDRDGRLVEIHRAFLPGRRIRVDYDALWARSRPLDSECVQCRRLSPEDIFLYHCFHMGMHEFSVGGLRSVWELRQLVLHDLPDLTMAAERSRRWGTIRSTWCSLELLVRCFPAIVGPADRERFAPPWPVRVVLDKLVIEPSLQLLARPGLIPRPLQLFRKALLVDRPSSALSYLAWFARAHLTSRLHH